jgi:uncharacterized phage protein gp47/JayE
MTVQLSDLIATTTPDAALRTLLAWLALGNFPVTAWAPGSVAPEVLDAESRAYADAFGAVGQIAKGGLLDLAEDDWLTLLAHNVYQVDRQDPIFFQTSETLTDGGGIGPLVIAPGQLWFTAQSGQRYTNTTGGTLPLNGTLTLTVQAESPGAAWNVPVGTIAQLASSLPGVRVTNPFLPTQYGADQESDTNVKIRCRARWPSLGSGATALEYQAWALTASAEVSQVAVFENTPSDGQVQVVLASAGGGVSSGAVAAVQAYIQTRRPLCVKANVASATQVATPVTATLTVGAAYTRGAAVAAQQNLLAFNRTLGIGQTVYRAALIEQLMLVPGAINAVLSTPPADVVLTPTQIATFSPTLAVVSA